MPPFRRKITTTVIGAVCAALFAWVGIAAAGSTPAYKITVVNSTGQDPANVFVTLIASNATPPWPSNLPSGLAMGTAYALDPIGVGTPWVSEGGNRYSISVSGGWNSGTILYSIGKGYANKPTAGANNHPYDFSEITVNGGSTFALNGDISSVDQIGVPARLSVLAPGRVQALRDGSAQPATEYVGCVASTWNLLNQYAGNTWPSGTAQQAVYRTAGGSFLQLLGPSAGGAWANYPSFQQYVQRVVGAGITITGNFAGSTTYGSPASTYSYTGTVTQDGQWIKMSGTLGNSAYTTKDIYVPLSEMYGHNDSVWTGANGYGVYRQNGPYVLAGPADPQPGFGATAYFNTAPPFPAQGNTSGPLTISGYSPVNPPSGAYATDANDIYGWMYGDLVASFAMGYAGSNYGSNSVAWNTNAVPPWGIGGSGGPAPFAPAWTNPFPGYPLFNVYQAAVNATGTTYGSPLNDRFTPADTTSPELGVTPPTTASGPYSWAIELLAQNGCAQALSVSPASGPASGGQPVTIAGHNFHQGATVTFGGVAATGVQVSHNPATSIDTITAVTPSSPVGGGPVNVRVTNANGSKAQNIDTSMLPGAYAYPTVSGAAAGSPAAPGGLPLGVGVVRYPGKGCSSTDVVRAPLQAKQARAPKVTVPSGGIMALSVTGLPKKAEASVSVQVNGTWDFLGRITANAAGHAVLPRYSQNTRGQSLLIRVSAGRKGTRYLRTVAGSPRDWAGVALSPVVTSYPIGTCPVHYATARKPVTAVPGKAPTASVPLGGTTVVRVRGLHRNSSTGVDLKIGSRWRFVGRVTSASNGVLSLPPIAINRRGKVIAVRLRAGGATRYAKVRAS